MQIIDFIKKYYIIKLIKVLPMYGCPLEINNSLITAGLGGYFFLNISLLIKKINVINAKSIMTN